MSQILDVDAVPESPDPRAMLLADEPLEHVEEPRIVGLCFAQTLYVSLGDRGLAENRF